MQQTICPWRAATESNTKAILMPAHAKPTDAEVLARYVRDGRLRQYPARADARRVVLSWLASKFSLDRQYSEADVNDILRDHEVDHATLRRYLVDAGMLQREGGTYWCTPRSSTPE
jgi:hypothetical protein